MYDYADMIFACRGLSSGSNNRLTNPQSREEMIRDYFNKQKAPIKRKSEFNLAPNPAAIEVTISWNDSANNDASILITDVKSVIVKQEKVKSIKGRNSLTIPIGELSAGMYSVHLTTEGINGAKKLVIAR